MEKTELNLGILAHVDAGKTTLTERLLYEAGVTGEIGSVDAGTTQTDSLELERQRGITIKSAVASFVIADVHVNLIDTPGHPDFIAEVERVLSVLDGAVLVISAVEGVQPQTRILMRALQRLRIPTLLFVNKIDRPGAGDDRVAKAISERLGLTVVPMGSARALGTHAASFEASDAEDPTVRSRLTEVLAERDEKILAAYVEGSPLPSSRLGEVLASQVRRALVNPLFFGSALTGAGVEPLMAGIASVLPASAGDPDGPASAMVFKIERGASGEKIAYARIFSGRIATRDRLHFGQGREGKVTSIAVFEQGQAVRRSSVTVGAVAKLWGLAEVQIGDRIGDAGSDRAQYQFPPPTLESVAEPRDPDDRGRLRVALRQLAEQDPLIKVRQNDERHEISISLYGEVQKEVVQATLANDFELDVTFRETTPLYTERPRDSGEAVEILHAESNPYLATIGFRIDPAPHGSGTEFRMQVDHTSIPLYIYKTVEMFSERMAGYVNQALQEGVFGWEVRDCVVTMTKCNYSVPDGPPSRRGPLSTAADFRKLTPLVVMKALAVAGTVVCEPSVRVSLETPAVATGAVLSALARLGAVAPTSGTRGQFSVIEAFLSAARAQDLQRQLPQLTGGEGALESTFTGYQSVVGEQPTRRRTTPNPLNLDEYLREVPR